MWSVIAAAMAMIVYIGGTLGPSGVVTGWVLINAIGVGVAAHALCYGLDWAIAAARGR